MIMKISNQIIIFLAATLIAFVFFKLSVAADNTKNREGLLLVSALKTCKEIEIRKYKGALRVKCVEQAA
jgi:hypothetical protein